MGIHAFGVPTVTDPTDQLTGPDLDAGEDALGDPPPLAVIGSRRVVVQMDVVRAPPVGMIDGERATALGVQIVGIGRPVDVADHAVGGRNDRNTLDAVGADVDPEV